MCKMWKTNEMNTSKRVVLFTLFLSVLSGNSAFAVESTLAYFGIDGHLQYGLYANQGESNAVNRLPDFSYCGYKGGGVAIPTVPTVVTIYPGTGDDTALIQAAINTASARTPDGNGFRGAVLLKAGRYQVASTLNITASGVVLRGEGQDTLGTVLEATTHADYDVIVVGSGTATYGAQSGTIRTITTSYVPVGATSFAVASATGYAVGNPVIVQRTPNQFWIDDLVMGGLETPWTTDSYDIEHERIITGINGNTITVNIPLVDVIQTLYGGGRIYKPNTIPRINKCGIENLRIESCYASDTDELHPWDAIVLKYLEDGWVCDVTAQYFAYSCVSASSYARYITIEDCAFIDPKSIIDGGRRYSFNLEETATRIFFQRCFSQDSRHDFVSGSRTRGPNVFVDCYANRSNADTGPHHRWATGILFDNVFSSEQLSVENRLNLGSGHGWSGANIVFWNCQAPVQVCDSPKGAMNFAIGSVAVKTEGGQVPAEPFGWWESLGTPVSPRSLYFQQLIDRLGQTAFENVTIPKQRTQRIWSDLLAWQGNGTLWINPIDTATPKDQLLHVGSDVIFEVVPVEGSTILGYQWYEVVGSDNLPIGGDSPLLIISNAQISDAGRIFFCRITTDSGPYWSSQAQIINIATGMGGELVEDFTGRTEGVTIDNLACNGTLGGIWDTEGDGTGNVKAQTADGSMTLLVGGHSGGLLSRGGGMTDLTNPITNTETGVLFFRFKVNNGAKTVQHYLGLHHYTGSTFLDITTCIGSAVTAGFGVSAAASSSTFSIVTTDNVTTLKSGLARNQWYNAWIVANNATDTFDLYVNTASGPGNAVESPLVSDKIASSRAFGVATASPLTGAMFLAPSLGSALLPLDSMNIDDIYWDGDNGLGMNPTPAVPQNLTAVGGYGYIALDWTDNIESDFSSYVLYRSITSGTGYTRLAAGLTGSSYTDTGLDLRTKYYYVVRAENTGGALSGFSEESSTAPRLPGDLNANGKVDLADFTLLAKDWGKTSGIYTGDISGLSGVKDGNVDIYDLIAFSEDWLQ
jgi:hypothetical protein